MTNVATSLYSFFNSFSIPAYVEYNVPEDAKLPYITYTLSQYDWNTNGTMQVRLWYESTGFADIFTKADEILREIGEGKTIQAGNGFIFLCKGSPVIQLQPSDDVKLKIAYINLGIKTVVKE